jgi:hypothetical protein
MFCGKNVETFNVQAGGEYSTSCTSKGFKQLSPNFNTLHTLNTKVLATSLFSTASSCWKQYA